MWPKVFAQLMELLPHISRLVPMADMFFASRSASERANEAAIAALAKDVRGELAQFGLQTTAAQEGLYRQLQQQNAQLAEVAAYASRACLAAESGADQSVVLGRQVAALMNWVRAAVLLIVLLIGAVVLLIALALKTGA